MADLEPPLNSAQLAVLLGLAVETVRIYTYKKPDRLPPRVTWSTRPLWSRAVVAEWIEERNGRKDVIVKIDRPPVKKGRPRKIVNWPT
jgi:predicted DNA-binding transcriptional regulator AlpA